MILARVLGAREYGAYAFSMAWVALLGTCAILGTDRLVVREIARLQPESAWSTIRGLLRRTNQLVAAASLASPASRPSSARCCSTRRCGTPFIIAMLLVPVLSLSLLRQAAMQGCIAWRAECSPSRWFAPGLLVLLAGIAALASLELDASEAVELTLIAAAISLGVGALLLRMYLPAAVRAARASYESRVWIRSALALTALSGVTSSTPSRER